MSAILAKFEIGRSTLPNSLLDLRLSANTLRSSRFFCRAAYKKLVFVFFDKFTEKLLIAMPAFFFSIIFEIRLPIKILLSPDLRSSSISFDLFTLVRSSCSLNVSLLLRRGQTPPKLPFPLRPTRNKTGSITQQKWRSMPAKKPVLQSQA